MHAVQDDGSRSGLADGAEVGGTAQEADLDDGGAADGTGLAGGLSAEGMGVCAGLVEEVAFVHPPAFFHSGFHYILNGFIQGFALGGLEGRHLAGGEDAGCEEDILAVAVAQGVHVVACDEESLYGAFIAGGVVIQQGVESLQGEAGGEGRDAGLVGG